MFFLAFICFAEWFNLILMFALFCLRGKKNNPEMVKYSNTESICNKLF